MFFSRKANKILAYHRTSNVLRTVLVLVTKPEDSGRLLMLIVVVLLRTFFTIYNIGDIYHSWSFACPIIAKQDFHAEHLGHFMFVFLIKKVQTCSKSCICLLSNNFSHFDMLIFDMLILSFSTCVQGRWDVVLKNASLHVISHYRDWKYNM